MEYSKEELQDLLNKSTRVSDFCRNLGVKPAGGNYRSVQNLIVKYELDASHLVKEPWNKGRSWKLKSHSSLQDYLVENSLYKNTASLKARLFKEGLKEQKCEICGYTENLELHHINGNPSDNRLENLQILCPNCHSKTNNFRGKNKSEGRIHDTPESLFLSEEEAQERYIYKTIRRRRLPEELRKTRPCVELVCECCGKTFKSKRPTQKYCSPECYHNKQDNRPDIISLLKAIKEYKSFVQIGNHFNVSDNAVRKWCKLYKLPEKTKDLQNIIDLIEFK